MKSDMDPAGFCLVIKQIPKGVAFTGVIIQDNGTGLCRQRIPHWKKVSFPENSVEFACRWGESRTI
jgi:hypothetical protein